jgi:hypothetical protein
MPLSQISRRLKFDTLPASASYSTPQNNQHVPIFMPLSWQHVGSFIKLSPCSTRGCMVLSSCKSPRGRARQFQYTTVLAFGYYNNGDRSVGNDQQMRSKSRSKGLAQSNVSDCFAQPCGCCGKQINNHSLQNENVCRLVCCRVDCN